MVDFFFFKRVELIGGGFYYFFSIIIIFFCFSITGAVAGFCRRNFNKLGDGFGL